MTDDSNMTQDWIDRVVKANPCVQLPNGNLRTCPVRLSFVNLFERSKPVPPATEGSYNANLLFPLGADISVLQKGAADAARAKWPTVGTPQAPKLKSPFKDQGEMLKYAGYQAGGIYIIPTARVNKPLVVDQRMAPLTDKAQAPSGYWAICTLNPFTYDKGVNKGVAFGLQSVMIIAEDKVLGGGGENVNEAFAGVSIDANVNPADAFGQGAVDPFA